MRLFWENIYDTSDEPISGSLGYFEDTYRAKVIGGWLIKNVLFFDHTDKELKIDGWQNTRVEICFLPDPKHEWDLNIMDGVI